ncbi:MAG: NADH-quinone oxidoreductase subunit J [Aquificaceae bacterium]|nr:NADH-quinone oxidoreductase subunit J [Aquificaceae bacterium]MCS7307730.1 NADH-quinone oxidoreductase subunit J [Aquificaceae bacterium]MCX8076422.1 NADH-quinone oxidoreductase subunit J [Aquificaceae bacterium]MDW8096488.1 NADH-quinone oxidoreductase subunit J [Aquificaceae bacterium]
MEWLIFAFLSTWAVLSVMGVLFLKNPVHALLSFVSLILAVAGMFLHLRAELLAGLQLIIYAVAIVVFYVLVITTIPWEKVKRFEGFYKREFFLGFPILLLSFALFAYAILKGNFASVGLEVKDNVKEVGKSLFTTYLLPLEVASVILLTAMIGAILLGRKEE